MELNLHRFYHQNEKDFGLKLLVGDNRICSNKCSSLKCPGGCFNNAILDYQLFVIGHRRLYNGQIGILLYVLFAELRGAFEKRSKKGQELPEVIVMG